MATARTRHATGCLIANRLTPGKIMFSERHRPGPFTGSALTRRGSTLIRAGLITGTVLLSGRACSDTGSTDFARSFAGPIERAHGFSAWNSKEAFQSNIVVEFGGQEILNGRMVFELHNGRSRIELGDGTLLVFDGQDAWVSPARSDFRRARFHLLTWSYFLSAPMKIRDPGTHLTDLGTVELEGVAYPAAKLTFDPGTGDTPDDWYVLFRDPETSRLHAMGFIVTYGRTVEQALEKPEAIIYHNFVDVDGVLVPAVS